MDRFTKLLLTDSLSYSIFLTELKLSFVYKENNLYSISSFLNTSFKVSVHQTHTEYHEGTLVKCINKCK